MKSEYSKVAGLTAACLNASGAGKPLFVEELLYILRQEIPAVAQIVGAILVGVGDERGSALGRELVRSIGEYGGGPVVDSVPDLSVDVLVLTVKPVELRAARHAFGLPEGTKPLEVGPGQLRIWTAEVDEKRYGIAMVGTAGNVESAVLLGGLLQSVQAKAAVMVGMAAGVLPGTDLGDVIVSENVFAYEFQRMTAKGPIFGPKTFSIDERRIRNAEMLADTMPQWPDTVRDESLGHCDPAEWPADEFEVMAGSWRPRVKRGGILAGGKLFETAHCQVSRKRFTIAFGLQRWKGRDSQPLAQSSAFLG